MNLQELKKLNERFDKFFEAVDEFNSTKTFGKISDDYHRNVFYVFENKGKYYLSAEFDKIEINSLDDLVSEDTLNFVLQNTVDGKVMGAQYKPFKPAPENEWMHKNDEYKQIGVVYYYCERASITEQPKETSSETYIEDITKEQQSDNYGKGTNIDEDRMFFVQEDESVRGEGEIETVDASNLKDAVNIAISKYNNYDKTMYQDMAWKWVPENEDDILGELYIQWIS